MGLTKQQSLTVGVLLAGAMLVVLNQTLLSPALPTIMRDMDISRSTVQWVVSIYSLTEAVVIPMAAFVMGLASTRRVYIVCMALYAAGTALCAWSPTFGVLLVGRVVEACATGILMPMVMAAILLIFPREKRGAAMGLVSLIIGIAPAAGPVLGGYLTDTMGWRESFLIVAVISVVIFVCAVALLRWDHSFARAPFDAPSVVLSTLGLGGMLYGFSNLSSGTGLAPTLGAIAVGCVLVGLFVRRQNGLSSPMLRVDLLRNHDFAVDVVVCMIAEAVFIGGDTLITMYAQNVLGQSATAAGLIVLPCAALGAVASLLGGRMYDSVGVHKTILRFCATVYVGGVLMFFFDARASVVYVAVVYALMEFGLCVALTPIQTWGFNALKNEEMQHATPLQNTMNQVAAAFGTALLVSLTNVGALVAPAATAQEQTAAGYQMTMAAVAVATMATITIAIFLVRDRKAQTAAEQSAEGAAGASKGGARDARSRRAAQAAGKGTGTAAPAAADDASLAAVADSAMEGVPVSRVMSADVQKARTGDTLGQVAQKLAATGTSGLPIVDDTGKVAGFISDGDIVRYLGTSDFEVSDGKMVYHVSDDKGFSERVADMTKLGVMSIATRRVVSLSPDDPVGKACRVLAQKRIKKAPVVDEDGRLVGSISRRDVIRSVMSQASTE